MIPWVRTHGYNEPSLRDENIVFAYHQYINYIRDKRSPVPKSEAVSRVMSANRPRDTKPELTLRQALYHSGHRGYRINYRISLNKNSPPYEGGVAEGRGGSLKDPIRRLNSVRPDITFVGRKLAIFVHGCYWHRCPKCNYPLPKNNTDFWQAKFDRNTARDEHKRRELKRLGWKVITVWECDLKKRPTATLNRILTALA